MPKNPSRPKRSSDSPKIFHTDEFTVKALDSSTQEEICQLIRTYHKWTFRKAMQFMGVEPKVKS